VGGDRALAAAATGETARFGPVFVAQSYLAITAAALVIAPLLAGVLGLPRRVAGRRRERQPRPATCGIGGGAARWRGGLGWSSSSSSSRRKARAATQAHGIADAFGSILTTAVVAAVVGAVTGVLGLVTE